MPAQSKPERWADLIGEKWISVHGSILAGFRNSSRKLLMCRDKTWRWTFMHALFAVKDDIGDQVRAVLTYIHHNNPGWMSQLAAKNIHGETPMHTAIKSGNTNILHIFLDLVNSWHLSGLLKVILETKNNHGYTPLQLSCVMRRYEMFEFLLEVCIRDGLCQDVTGVAAQLAVTASAKLLPEALAKGDWKILDIFLKVLQRLNYSPEEMIKILNLPNEKGERTWSLLMECDIYALQKVCQILYSSDYNIHLDDLHTDEYGSTMLHLAFRTNYAEKIAILKECECDPNRVNSRGYMACERSHTLHKTHTTQTQPVRPKSLSRHRRRRKRSSKVDSTSPAPPQEPPAFLAVIKKQNIAIPILPYSSINKKASALTPRPQTLIGCEIDPPIGQPPSVPTGPNNQNAQVSPNPVSVDEDASDITDDTIVPEVQSVETQDYDYHRPQRFSGYVGGSNSPMRQLSEDGSERYDPFISSDDDSEPDEQIDNG